MQANVQVLEVVVADVLKVLLDSGLIDSRVARALRRGVRRADQ